MIHLIIPSLNPGVVGFIWLIIAIFFLLTELTTPGLFFFIAFAVGSLAASLFAFLGYSFMIQCIASVSVAVISFFLFRQYLVHKPKKKIETNVEALIGEKAIVLTKIEPYKIGQVKVKGEIWTAESEGNVFIGVNNIVSIVMVRGNRLIVKQ